jgi:hypothetical protein
MPPVLHTPSWRGALFIKHRDRVTLRYLKIGLIHFNIPPDTSFIIVLHLRKRVDIESQRCAFIFIHKGYQNLGAVAREVEQSCAKKESEGEYRFLVQLRILCLCNDKAFLQVRVIHCKDRCLSDEIVSDPLVFLGNFWMI